MSQQVKLNGLRSLFQQSYLSPCLPHALLFESDGTVSLLYPDSGDEHYPTWQEAFDALEFQPPILTLALTNQVTWVDSADLNGAADADRQLELWYHAKADEAVDPNFWLERAQTLAEEAVPGLGGQAAWDWSRQILAEDHGNSFDADAE